MDIGTFKNTKVDWHIEPGLITSTFTNPNLFVDFSFERTNRGHIYFSQARDFETEEVVELSRKDESKLENLMRLLYEASENNLTDRYYDKNL